MLTTMNDGTLANRMGENCRQRIIREFGIDKMAGKTGKIYVHLLEENCRVAGISDKKIFDYDRLYRWLKVAR